MNTITFNNAINTEDIAHALAYLEKPGATSSQTATIRVLKMKAGGKDIGLAILIVIFTAVLNPLLTKTNLGWMGLRLIVVSALIYLLSLFFLLRGVKRLVETTFRPRTNSANVSLEQLCTRFYHDALCKTSIMGLTSEYIEINTFDDQFSNITQYFPGTVLKKYAKTGWSAFDASPYLRAGAASSLECENCHKKVLSAYKTKAAQIGFSKIDSMFARCDYCGKVLCFVCGFVYEPKERRALCPFCGQAAGGWNGLLLRWAFCQQAIKKTSPDIIEIVGISIETTARDDPRVMDIAVDITIKPGLHLWFTNTVIKILNCYYLVSPEPGTIINPHNHYTQ